MMGLWGKRDGNRMLILDDKEIQSTHDPDDEEHDVSPLHKLINEILMPSTTTAAAEAKEGKIGSPTQMGQGQGQVDGDHLANPLVKRYKELKGDFFEPDSQPKPAIRYISDRCFEEWAEIVPEISIEVRYKCSGRGEGDVNKTTMAVFKMLSRYSWEVKIFVTLAAFALIYEDSLPMAKNTEPIQHLIDAMVQLINTITDLDVDDSLPENISTHIQTAVSWTVGSIVICTSHIRYIEDELSILTEKFVEMNNSLGQLLDTWGQKGRLASSSTQQDYENVGVEPTSTFTKIAKPPTSPKKRNTSPKKRNSPSITKDYKNVKELNVLRGGGNHNKKIQKYPWAPHVSIVPTSKDSKLPLYSFEK